MKLTMKRMKDNDDANLQIFKKHLIYIHKTLRISFAD